MDERGNPLFRSGLPHQLTTTARSSSFYHQHAIPPDSPELPCCPLERPIQDHSDVLFPIHPFPIFLYLHLVGCSVVPGPTSCHEQLHPTP